MDPDPTQVNDDTDADPDRDLYDQKFKWQLKIIFTDPKL
jgi:hypothetical protein